MKVLSPIRVIAVMLLLSLFAAADDERNGDQVHFSGDIHVGRDDTARDLVCMFCSIKVDGKARDVVAFMGSVQVNGTTHDVVVFSSDLTLGGESEVHDSVVLGGTLHADRSAIIRGDHVVLSPMVMLIPFFLSFLLVIPFVWLFKRVFGRPQRRVVYVNQTPR